MTSLKTNAAGGKEIALAAADGFTLQGARVALAGMPGIKANWPRLSGW